MFQAGAGGADADLVVCGLRASTAGFLKEEHRPGKTRARGRSAESSHAGGWGASWAIANWYPSVSSGAYERLNATEGALAHPHTDNKCHSVTVSRLRVVSRELKRVATASQKVTSTHTHIRKRAARRVACAVR